LQPHFSALTWVLFGAASTAIAIRSPVGDLTTSAEKRS